MSVFQGHGKCILAGEHTVLRGGHAVVMPLHAYTVTLEKTHAPKGLWLENTGLSQSLTPLPDQARIMAFLAQSGVPLTHGYVVRMAMPFGRGLGASAALSVALAKAAQPPEEKGVFELAWALEHLFHGTSSGADVAGALASRPLVYQGVTPFQQPLRLAWSPVFYLTDSGTAVPTADAIATVARLRAQDQHLADGLDTQMKEATRGVIEALERVGGGAQLTDALHQASDCFTQWGLVTPAMAALMTSLRSAGAQAVKPTGAGLGGMVLSFWQSPPPLSLLDRLILVEMRP